MTDKLDFISYLRNWCNSKGIYFAAGESDYINAYNDQNIFENLDLILCADLTLTPSFSDTGVSSVTYNGYISLGRKRETESQYSSIDETFLQKYDNRLKDLAEILVGFFGALQCEQEATINTCTLDYLLNHTDVNIDFVSASVSITFE